MEEVKQEQQKVEVPTTKETYSKEEVDALINKKISDTFGDLIKELNKKEVKKEEPKEKTLEDLYF